jgi:hypothetical protein
MKRKILSFILQTLLITDAGLGLGPTSLKNMVLNLNVQKQQGNILVENSWLTFPYPSKLSIICMGNPLDPYFKKGRTIEKKIYKFPISKICIF